MRALVLMRGVAGCGKSTWIANKNLKQYTICADDIRLLMQSPVLTVDGNSAISQSNDRRVWEFVMQLVEARMERGEFIIVDATHSRATQINNYRKLAETYRYRVYVVDFSDVPYEQIVQQNEARKLSRDAHKYVPREAIDTMYARITTQPAPGWVKVIKPDEYDATFTYAPKDFSQYKRIHHIGDLHGCYTVLREYLDTYSSGMFKDDECYIFLGDYVDRGIENYELVTFLMEQRDKPNVLFLEGNHEKWLRMYAHDDIDNIRSREFIDQTMPQLIGVDKKALREWVRRFGQLAYYNYPLDLGMATVFVNHGGIPVMPNYYIAAHELIHGTGRYEDIDAVQQAFSNSAIAVGPLTYQVHGHRNIEGQDFNVHIHNFNLCDKVEFGGDLRVLALDHKGFHWRPFHNTVYREFAQPVKLGEKVMPSVDKLVRELRAAKGVQEKRYDVQGNKCADGCISSFNFTRKVFYTGDWDDLNELARSLYINTNTMEIVGRAYPKWFKVNEVDATKMSALKNTLTFPLNVYVKENGFLGLVGYDSASDTVLYMTKTSLSGDYAEWFKAAFTEQQREKVEAYVRTSGHTLIFECIDFDHDPHIIKRNSAIAYNVLLDSVARTLEYSKLSHDELSHVAREMGLKYKKAVFPLENWQQFESFVNGCNDYVYDDIEGYVIEDANGYCVKLKTEYYNFWKNMRGVKETLRGRRPLDMRRFITARENRVVAWLKKRTPEELALSIPALRDMYEAECGKE